jgi:hypothetical protein
VRIFGVFAMPVTDKVPTALTHSVSQNKSICIFWCIAVLLPTREMGWHSSRCFDTRGWTKLMRTTMRFHSLRISLFFDTTILLPQIESFPIHSSSIGSFSIRCALANRPRREQFVNTMTDTATFATSSLRYSSMPPRLFLL